jgi:hypothetical protein
MIIGTRTLKLEKNNSTSNVAVRVYSPEQREEDWICRFEIDWPDGKVAQWGTGDDGIDAIFRALQMIGALLYASASHQQGKLSWLETGAGFGFPVPKNIRDLLEGDDKRYL